MINGIMPKSISISTIRRRRRPGAGRPPVGPFVGARLPQELIDMIDAWASRECNGSRSEAIRPLGELGLAAGEPSAPKRGRGERTRKVMEDDAESKRPKECYEERKHAVIRAGGREFEAWAMSDVDSAMFEVAQAAKQHFRTSGTLEEWIEAGQCAGAMCSNCEPDPEHTA